MKIATKLSIISAVILLTLVMILTINATYDLNRQMQVTEKNEAKKIEQGIEDTIAQQFDLLRIGLEPIIHNEQIIDAFQQRDRAALAQQTNVLMPQLQAQGVKQFQFHLPNATSFYRVHKPEEFGDDLSTFRHTVVEANKTKQIIEGLEGGVAGAGFRYVVPLSKGTTHLGTVELGLGVTEELLQKFSALYDGNWALYSIEDQSTTLVEGEAQTEEPTASDIKKLQEGKTVTTLSNQMQQMYYPLEDYTGEIKWYLARALDYSAVIKAQKNQTLSLILVGVVVSIVGLLVLLFVVRRILRPLSRITESVEKIANGDLTVQPQQSRRNDEIGQLSRSFAQMTISLKSLIISIQTQSEDLLHSTEQIGQSMRDNEQGTRKVVQTIGTINDQTDTTREMCVESARAMDDLADGIVGVADDTGLIVEAATTMTSLTHKGNDTLASAVTQMNVIKDNTKQFATVIEELNDDSNEIGTIMQMITSIAEQTNLLALNAAIEAARAGEFGQGFAVVAEEIRQLADQTTQSASSVHQLINQIQAKTQHAVVAMQESNEEVQTGADLLNYVGTAFTKIEQSVTDLTTQIEGLSSISERMSAGAEEVSAAVQNIAETADQTASSTTAATLTADEQLAAIAYVTQTALRLTEMAKQLEESVSTFQVEAE
ncbi:MAG TPA: methyl-accepting chemotaxis protein [Metalysinibacillus jejuensis]|uniref:Methyl-accepting chemotaxis protein n=1 Tax=Metalysinibacillus jejuensis TaxID=914327 RepID=A0A921T5G9_9BACL|nr:methyl-accepting chemotaxis protein [Metalysinibacillus jejuensis]